MMDLHCKTLQDGPLSQKKTRCVLQGVRLMKSGEQAALGRTNERMNTRSQGMRPFWQPVALLAGAADFFEAEAPFRRSPCINNTVAEAHYCCCPPPGLFSLVNILP